MCGISGIYTFGNSSKISLRSAIDLMTDALKHRGPDSRDIWIDEQAGIAFGHRRLAIRDLSELGHQPMHSSCGRFVIIYNGEVYSHNEIRKNLLHHGRYPKGDSDTEVVLEACAAWGIEKTVEQMIGMFAFALFDIRQKVLYLVRDRLGIKPLYWANINGVFFFGSELKALRSLNCWHPELDRNALAAFMRHNYIPAPHTIYKNVQKLAPGCILRIGLDANPRIIRFWDLHAIVKEGVSNQFESSDHDVINELDNLLRDAVKRRMVADVSLGTFLSGGIDSSLITSLMAEQSERPVNTFSIGFNENEYNEAPYAAQIAKYLKTNHTEFYVEPKDAIDLVDKLQHCYDEPFADSSQIPTLLVCEMAKRSATVVLSGDGGDELFGGYNRYTLGVDLWKKANIAPYPIRKILAHSIRAISPENLDKWSHFIPQRYRISQFGNKLHKFANSVLLADPDAMYRQMLSHWDPDALIIDAEEHKGILWDNRIRKTIPHFLDRMQFFDSVTYLPDDILTKVDRASMSVSLEVRVPLLDHRVVEFAWRMPRHMKIQNEQSKWALRQILYRRIPPHLIERPKMGFGVPIDKWVRGPLRDWAEYLLDEKRLKSQGLLKSDLIRERWKAHLEGTNWIYPLWTVLMAQAWIEANPDVAL